MQWRRRRNWPNGAVVMFVMAGVVMPTDVLAQEVAPFRLTGIEGNLSVRYLGDSLESGAAGNPTTVDSFRTLEEELFVLTHSYFYHPNFLKADIGLGPLFVQNRVESESGGVNQSNSANESLYNLTARLSFFEPKAFPVVLYHEHLNPTVSTSVLQSFVVETNKTGANFTLREPLSPVLFYVDGYHQTSQGEGQYDIVDEILDQLTARIGHNLGKEGSNQITLTQSDIVSRSGVKSLGIQAQDTQASGALMDTRLRFGQNRNVTATSILDYRGQKQTIGGALFTDRTDWRWTPDVRWDHSPATQSYYRYNYYGTEDIRVSGKDHRASAGVIYRPDDRLAASAELRGQQATADGSPLGEDSTFYSYGAGGTASYRWPYSAWLTTFLSASLNYDIRGREAQDVVAAPIQTLSISSTVWTNLDFPNVIFTAPYTPIVRNSSGQIVIEGLDYEFQVIGTVTQIRRIATSVNLTEGESVTVEYYVLGGGTFSMTTFEQVYHINVVLFRYYTPYARYRDYREDLRSGTPNIPLNSVRDTQVGFRVDYPFWTDWSVGGDIYYVNHDEDLTPFDQDNAEVYLQMFLPYSTSLRLTARRTQIDYSTGPADVDLTGYGVYGRTRILRTSAVTAEYSHEQDQGGNPREYDIFALGFEWRFRKLSFRADWRYTQENQAGFARDRSLVRGELRRDF